MISWIILKYNYTDMKGLKRIKKSTESIYSVASYEEKEDIFNSIMWKIRYRKDRSRKNSSKSNVSRRATNKNKFWKLFRKGIVMEFDWIAQGIYGQ